ncbi:microtubule-associated proteins 1A/1B light chain 3C-like isoform X2 [Dendronephthya gigantea]|uniref:microtubule-associated proteins 1A/1B light chain 3C-like isoform X2 n=1 Tax=Dendronephthya gigantea TaxID=151771 RepID=UPI00106D3D11|nr:microtubule-associated proteins 1A/1B light chain 3C-like isoform X2 [Dendronephthya gigantea]
MEEMGRAVKTSQTIDVDKVNLLSERESRMHKPFKSRKTFGERQSEAQGIRVKFPAKIPVIVERYQKEKNLPQLDKTKFLVPEELTISQFVTIIRNLRFRNRRL